MLSRAFRITVKPTTTALAAANARPAVYQYSTLGEKAKKVGDKVGEAAQAAKEKFNKATADVNAKTDDLKSDANAKAEDLKKKAKEQAEKTGDDLDKLRQ